MENAIIFDRTAFKERTMNTLTKDNEKMREIISILMESTLYLDLTLEERSILIKSLLGA
jgi:hypothetical protein